MKKLKRLLLFVIIYFIFVPFIKVNGLTSCFNGLITTSIENFECTEVNGDLKFTYNGNDYSSYFTVISSSDSAGTNLKTIALKLNKDIPFEDKTKEQVLISVSDSSSSTYTLLVKNTNYSENATTTTSTTTTKIASVYTVTLDPNNGENVTTETCTPTENNTSCNVKLPTFDRVGFNGWGTAKTCKDGKVGMQSVSGDTTYYACYSDTTTKASVSDNKLQLNSLNLIDEEKKETINFGTFSKKKLTYSFKVLNDVENISVDAKADEDVNVEVTGNENLKEGNNTILIKLSNEEGESGTYTLNVTKLKEGEIISTEHLLKSLVVGPYNINFDKKTLIYDLTIGSDIKKLDIEAIPEEDEIEPEISGNNNLVNGSKIMITLTGEDEKSTIYSINIIKEKNTNIILICAISIIVLLIIVLVVLIIIKSNKKKKISNNKPNNNIKNNTQQSDIEVFKI